MLSFDDAMREVFQVSGDRMEASLANDMSMLQDYDSEHFRGVARHCIAVILKEEKINPSHDTLGTLFASAFHAGRKVGQAENKLDLGQLGITEASINECGRGKNPRR